LFLDSFENSSNYICIQDKENIFNSNTEGDYLIIQKTSHPDFNIKKSDSIIYYNRDGNITFTKINQISSIASIKKYHSDFEKNGIFEDQILGKIIEIVDENIINSISIKVWETSINKLNIRALITK
jgi:hypothetical protein